MTVKDFAQKSKNQLQKNGMKALPEIAADFSVSAISKIPYTNRIGTNVFSRSWDILVILDACRLDVYQDNINSQTDAIWSVGSSSQEWMKNTFSKQDTSQVEYITGNVFSREYIDKERFQRVEEVWKYGWDDKKGTIPPRPITNEAIRSARQSEHSQMIVHYMQPHFPAIGSDLDLGGEISRQEFGHFTGGETIWTRMRSGDIKIKDAWQAYQDNLKFVWEEVCLLRNNVTGKVAITADHGNSFGEWGVYGHPVGLQSPYLRKVPWDEYHCQDRNTHRPIKQNKENTSSSTAKERLESLGYV